MNYRNSTKLTSILLLILLVTTNSIANSTNSNKESKSLRELQEDFINLKFGMFIHYNMPTYLNADWVDPNAPISSFNTTSLDCEQWAKAAKSANMTYGCLTTKHHSGFCIWDTKTTDYNVMNSPLKRDVVKEYADAFRKEGLEVMLYYSILDTHHNLRPNLINNSHIDLVKSQITELLTNYGDISALFIDGWDAPWSRISYDDIPFEDIYNLVKSIQPNCLIMDLNAAKYPEEGLYYTDIKSYEQGAGQHISRENNDLPALSCLPLQKSWFWKEDFPNSPVKDPISMINENIIPLNKAYCNFILNVAPNKDGLIDDNAIEALKIIGENRKDDNVKRSIKNIDNPIISSNIAKFKPTNSSWSYDMRIMDLANDDDFTTYWASNEDIKTPWFEVDLIKGHEFNMITIADLKGSIKKYKLLYEEDGEWKQIPIKNSNEKVKIHRFDQIWGNKVKIVIEEYSPRPSISEFGVYNEKRK